MLLEAEAYNAIGRGQHVCACLCWPLLLRILSLRDYKFSSLMCGLCILSQANLCLLLLTNGANGHLSGNAVAPVTLVEQLTRASWYLALCCSHDNVLCALLACCLDVCSLLCLAQSQKHTSRDNKLIDLRCCLCALNQNYLCPCIADYECQQPPIEHACVQIRWWS